MGTLLLYGFDELNEVMTVKAAVSPYLVEVKPVWREDYRRPVGALAGRPLQEDPESRFSGSLGGRMMVFCDLDDQLDVLLPALRGANIGPECYKAVLTASNQGWNGVALFAELQRERQAIAEQRRKKETT